MDSLDRCKERVVKLTGTYFTWYSYSHAPHNNPGYPLWNFEKKLIYLLYFLDPKEDLDAIMKEDLYPFKVVDEDGVIGSCSTYKTRKIIENISKEKMDNENSIVFVASQIEREKALLGSQYDPLIIRSFAPMAYALLERIGRAR